MVKVYRHLVNKTMLEFPSGHLEKNELLEDCAIRELLEETGHSVSKLEHIHSCYLSPGRTNQKVHFFYATDLHYVKKELDKDEELELTNITVEQLQERIKNKVIQNPITLLGFFLIASQNND